MKRKALITLGILLPIIGLTGCIQQVRYNVKQVQSDIFGLNREVTIYSIDGKPIKTIDGKFRIIYPSSNRMEFIKQDGRKTTVSGVYTAITEEK